MEIIINGINYKQESITINVVPSIFDPMKEKIRYLKSIGVELYYGTTDLPCSISFEKGYDLSHLRMLGIDFSDIKREYWF